MVSIVGCGGALALLVAGCLDDLVVEPAAADVPSDRSANDDAAAAPSWMVKSDHADRCLEIEGAAPGSTVRAAPCHGRWNQRWTSYLDGTIRNRHRDGERCLDVREAAAGSVLIAAACEDGKRSQRWDWRFSSDQIIHGESRACLELDPDDLARPDVRLGRCSGQRWHDRY